MIPSCIELPYIGLRNGCDDSSSSGFYINDLEGISLKLASQVTNGEVVRGEDLIRQKERSAIIDTIRDFRILINEDVKTKDIVHQEKLVGNWSDYMSVGRVGYKITRCNDDMTRLESFQICLFPKDSLEVQVNIDEDGSVRQVNAKLTGGRENCVKIDLKSNAQQILIYVNMCDHELKKLVDCTCDCGELCNECFTVSPVSYIDGKWKSFWPFIKMNIVCRCNWDELVCLYKDQLAQAAMYRLGIRLMYEVIFTQNYTGLIQNSKESASELLKIWEGVPDGATFDIRSEYYKSLKPVADMAKDYLRENAKCCIECKGFKVSTHCLN